MIVGRHATLIIVDDPVAEHPPIDIKPWFPQPSAADLEIEDQRPDWRDRPAWP